MARRHRREGARTGAHGVVRILRTDRRRDDLNFGAHDGEAGTACADAQAFGRVQQLPGIAAASAGQAQVKATPAALATTRAWRSGLQKPASVYSPVSGRAGRASCSDWPSSRGTETSSPSPSSPAPLSHVRRDALGLAGECRHLSQPDSNSADHDGDAWSSRHFGVSRSYHGLSPFLPARPKSGASRPNSGIVSNTPETTRSSSYQASRPMARPGLEPGTPRFSGHDNAARGCCQGSAVGSGDRDRGSLGERRMGRPVYD